MVFHVKHSILFLILSLFHAIAISQVQVTIQDKPLSIKVPRVQQIERTLSSFSHYRSLDSLEQDFFYWVNHLRTNPPDFAERILVKYLEQFPEMTSASSNDLLKELLSLGSLPTFTPEAGLSSVARKHALDLAHNKRSLSHEGSNGRDFATRIREIGGFKCASENLYEGRPHALEALIILLIDHGVPGFGHRRAILNPIHQKMGCSIVQRPDNGLYIFVQVFSCQ
jgi:hypothetical protein